MVIPFKNKYPEEIVGIHNIVDGTIQLLLGYFPKALN